MMALRYPPEFCLRSAARLCRSIQLNNVVSQRSYHAAVCSEIGKPLQITVQQRPELKSDQIRVAVKRAAINFSDILIIQGKYQEKPVLPFIPGSEIVAQVLEVGPEVKNVRPGDNVIGLLIQGGGFAEEVVASEQFFVPISSHLSPEEGAAAVVSYGTAEMALIRNARIKQSDVILVTAAAGSLGLAAVDLAANVFKATVIGACGGPEKCQLVSQYGAKFTIDYAKENVKERVKEITHGRGVDIVFDVVGGQALEDGLRCLTFEGRLLTLGYASGQIPKIPVNLLLVKNISVHGIYWGSTRIRKPDLFIESIKTVLKLWQDGKIKPYVGRVFPLSQVNEAIHFVASRHSTGKVLLDCTQFEK